MQVLLRSKGLTRTATVPISGGLLVDKERYFEALGAYRAGDAGPIIDQFTHASLRAVHLGRQLAARLTEWRDGGRETIRARSDSAAWKILDFLPGHPVIDAELVARELGIRPANVSRSVGPLVRWSVGPLVDAGILVGTQHDKSHKYIYRAPGSSTCLTTTPPRLAAAPGELQEPWPDDLA